jgi:hypothetical protein
VVAPRVRERQLNVLQKAVLGLCRAGVSTASRVSQVLHLHADLGAFILQELQVRGLLDSHGQLTPRGDQVLREETLESQQVVAGYVFQDPWTGELWPRYAERLEYAELESSADGHPNLVLGTTGSPRPQRAWMQLPQGIAEPAHPEPADILRVTRRHQRALSFASAPMEEDGEEETLAAASVDIDRVSMIDERPQAVFLATFLYVPREPGMAGTWHACDPFGLGDSARLRKSVERRMERDKGLRSYVSRLLGGSPGEDTEALLDRLQSLRARAEVEVLGHLPLEARRQDLHEPLVDMECARLEVEELGARCTAQKLREALLAVRRVMEAVFEEMRRQHPTDGVWRPLATDQAYNRGIYEATARALGLEVPLPRALAAVKQDKVRGVSGQGGAWQLRPMVVAALLAARSDTRHPLRRAARQQPRLLHELDDISDKAGTAIHGRARQQLEPGLVIDMVQRTWRVVDLLVGPGEADMHSHSQVRD